MGYFLDDLKAFGINADQWTTAAQDEDGRRITVEQGAEHFWRNGSLQRKPRLDYGMQSYARRCRKDQGENGPKQAGSRWFARPC